MKKIEPHTDDPYKVTDSQGKHIDRQITMKIPEEMYWDLKKLSEKKGNVPMGEIIRRATDDYIRKCRLKGIL